MIDTLISSYCVRLESENRSVKSIAWHHDSLGKFAARMRDTGHSGSPEDWTAPTVRTYYAALRIEIERYGRRALRI